MVQFYSEQQLTDTTNMFMFLTRFASLDQRTADRHSLCLAITSSAVILTIFNVTVQDEYSTNIDNILFVTYF